MISENVPKVYEAGKDAEYEKYWTPMWRNRYAGNFNNAFTGLGWNDDNFCPPVGVSPYILSSNAMFQRSYIVDLERILKERNITLDFSHSGFITALFSQAARLMYVPEIDCTGSNSMSNMFESCGNLVSVKKLILKETGTNTFANTFLNCTSLTEIRFEGVIGNNIDFSASTKLSKASLLSILTALSTTVTGKTATFSKVAKELAFTDEEWNHALNLRSNWTINLV
ncbi:MAG: hypothetical protein IJ367_02875 [Clostridia bacterium]|nr:hypothetical protein [Clostridia bacterium]